MIFKDIISSCNKRETFGWIFIIQNAGQMLIFLRSNKPYAMARN